VSLQSFMETTARNNAGGCATPTEAALQTALGHARFYLGPRSFEATGLPDPGLWRYAP